MYSSGGRRGLQPRHPLKIRGAADFGESVRPALQRIRFRSWARLISSESTGDAVRNQENASLRCPYCGEQIEVMVDCSVVRHEYVEDCTVCCGPIVITVVASQGELMSVEGRSENE